MKIQDFMKKFSPATAALNQKLGVDSEYKNVKEPVSHRLDLLSTVLSKGYPYMSVVQNNNANVFVASYGKKVMPFYNREIKKYDRKPQNFLRQAEQLIKDIICSIKEKNKEKLFELLIQYDNYTLTQYLRTVKLALEEQSMTGSELGDLKIVREITEKKRFDLQGLSQNTRSNVESFLDMVVGRDWSWIDESRSWKINFPAKNDRDYQVHVEAKGLYDAMQEGAHSSLKCDKL